MRLLDMIQGKLVVPRMRSRTKWDAIEELVDRLVEEHEIRLFDRQEVLEAVLSRERSQSTGLNRHVALPHGQSRAVEDLVGVLGISPQGIPFESTDGTAAQLVCLLVIPQGRYRDHIKILADVTRLLGEDSFRTALVRAAASGSEKQVLHAIEQTEGRGFLSDWRATEP